MPLAGDASPPTDPARPALMLLVSSVFELIAAVVLCIDGTCTGLNAYAVSVGAVSTCFSIAVLAALRYDDALPGVLLDLMPHTATFLLVWWLFGWLVLTFVRPFAGLCNGFFACWAALVAAIWLVRTLLPSANGFLTRFVEAAQGTLAEKAYVTALMATSTFVWVEASILYSMPPHDGFLAWTVGVGVASTVGCFVFLAMYEQLASHSRHVALGLLAWWLQGLIISFVPTAFTSSVNGFVAIWVSLALATYFAFGSHSATILPGASGSAAQYGPVGAAVGGGTPPPYAGGGLDTFGGGGGYSEAPRPATGLQAPPPTEFYTTGVGGAI